MNTCERGWSATFAARCFLSGVANDVAAMRAPCGSRTKNTTSADIVFFVRDPQGARIAATSFATPLKKHLAANVADQPRSHVFIGDTRYATQGAAVTTAGGEVVGGYVVMSA